MYYTDMNGKLRHYKTRQLLHKVIAIGTKKESPINASIRAIAARIDCWEVGAAQVQVQGKELGNRSTMAEARTTTRSALLRKTRSRPDAEEEAAVGNPRPMVSTRCRH